jgi:uncharacterized lipoprotein YmbA
MKLLLIAPLLLLTGCATKQPETTYWTEKSGIVVLHHVVGKTDTIEKLIHTQLSAEELKAAGLPKGTYFKVVQAQGQPSPAPTPSAPANKGSVATADNLADFSKQLRALRNQVQTVEAQNQRLQEELDAAASQKTAQQGQPPDRQSDPDQDVRMSQ